MWVFTELADAFDKEKDWENRFIDEKLQPWVGSTIYEDSPWYRNVGIYVAAGTLYSVNKITTTVGAGFVDVLRLGDGVRKGGWGYGKDALRLLMILGPAARFARWSVSLIKAVDTFPNTGNCAWVAMARLLRLTGTRPLAEIADVAKAAGIGAAQTGEVATLTELLPMLQRLGAAAQAGRSVANMTELTKLAVQNPQAAIMFGVQWLRYGKPVRHVLIAVRGLFGGLKIIDRTGGKVVKSLAELEQLCPGYGAIGSAVVTGETLIVQNTLVVKSLALIPSLANVVSHVAGHEPEPDAIHGSVSLDHVSVTLDAANHNLGAMNEGQGSTSHGVGRVNHNLGGAHHHRSHSAVLSRTAEKIYRALGTSRTPVTYREIMDRTHLHIDDVIAAVQELVDKGKVALVPLTKG
jgi:hypothetical protein